MIDGPLIAVLDYGIGNLRSAEKGLQRAGGDARLTADVDVIRSAAGVVLPGVGAFGRCTEALRASGLDIETRAAVDRGIPFLAICIGMQLLYERSDEDPNARGLALLPGAVRSIPEGVKRPQMQWNTLEFADGGHPLFAGLDQSSWFYFVHSYAPEPSDYVIATCDYGGPVVAAVARDNVWATQFHPEKSSANGIQVLANFVAACG